MNEITTISVFTSLFGVVKPTLFRSNIFFFIFCPSVFSTIGFNVVRVVVESAPLVLTVLHVLTFSSALGKLCSKRISLLILFDS